MYESAKSECAEQRYIPSSFPSNCRDGIGTDHWAMTVAKASLGQSLHLSG